MFDTAQLTPGQTTVTAVDSESSDFVSVEFADGARRRFGRDWLLRHSYAPEHRRQRERRARPELWDSSLQIPTFDAADVVEEPGGTNGEHGSNLEFLRILDRIGLAVVRGAGTAEGTVLKAGNSMGFVRTTNYGSLFDVVNVGKEGIGEKEGVATGGGNLAYTSLALGLHTDNPYRCPVPGIQLLHCLQPASGTL